MIAFWYVDVFTDVEFLWLNIVGAVAVFVVGVLVSAVTSGPRPAASIGR